MLQIQNCCLLQLLCLRPTNHLAHAFLVQGSCHCDQSWCVAHTTDQPQLHSSMRHPQAFIFDLDGLIIDTESLCLEVAHQVLAKYGKVLTKEAQRAALGKRPLDCWKDVAAILGLDVPAQQLFNESEPLLQERWADVRPLPGARRLLEHLHSCGAKVAIATSTSRATFQRKLSKKPWLQALFQASVCGDEVGKGKPAPDVFNAAAAALGVPASSCVCFEDAPSGVEGAVAAGMQVVVVPSLVESADEYTCISTEVASSGKGGVVQVLPSLLAFDATAYGLPPFSGLVEGVIPVDPVFRIKGSVVKGFGRGSKELGIPTANVDADSLRHSIAEAVTGIYCGWASIGDSQQVYKMVMSIGWNPFYKNKEKTAEPWILHDFDQPFYGQEIRLVVCGYVRPEANFSSLEALIERIHKDAEVSKAALDDSRLQCYASDSFLQQTAEQQQQVVIEAEAAEEVIVAASG